MRRLAPTVAGLLVAALALVGCGPGDSDSHDASGSPGSSAATATPTGPVPTLTPIQLPPDPPPSGKLLADLRQSSRDAALGRMEVWIANDTRRDVTPTRIRYVDGRFRTPLPGERLRLDPSRSERGFPLHLPARPACGAAGDAVRPRVLVTYAGRTVSLPVSDDNDIVQRYVDSRCLELAVDRVATLTFDDAVPSDGPGRGSTGTLTLVARPSGVPGHRLTVDTVGGTPLFSAAGQTRWAPGTTVASDGDAARIELPVQPARCDDHVFMEAAGATAFLVSLHLDGKPGQLVIRMSPAGASNAIGFARSSCGLD
ncbi:hypothetical protein H5V45_16065 [Nocardioides sp. KIGAM211]|uniref:Uncharacterized protein n=1 Tax=Nocardioides luti TaxID=2761101 RepID=A0A7X0VBJ7_9ACTN|nr:hypothetical protein [Nocardioides luti]MBB6628844.1 hypothetical protein [Nocardioides luti]